MRRDAAKAKEKKPQAAHDPKADWKKAIEQDGLVWNTHVSDLKFWNNAAARLYGVNSIPATYLVGPDGTILARNLRGRALENALQKMRK